MQKRRNVRLPHTGEAFSVVYSQENHLEMDADVAIYDRYKLSILLSDGLAAVMHNTVIDIGKHNILFFRPDEIHYGRFFRAGMHRYLDFYIPDSFFRELLDCGKITEFLEDTSEKHVNYILFSAENQKRIAELAEQTLKILQDHSTLQDVRLFSVMLQFVLLCAEHYEEQTRHPLQTKIPDMVANTLVYLSEHYSQKLSLEFLASRVGCSAAYLSRSFRQHTEQSVYQHLTNVRMEHARSLLRQGSSVTEACFSSGFDDCSNFIRTFRRHTGKTPLQYRNAFQNPQSDEV